MRSPPLMGNPATPYRPSLQGRSGQGPVTRGGTLAPKYQPAEQKHVEKDDDRSDRRHWIADSVSGVDEADPNHEDDGTDDPHPDLHARDLGTFQRRMEAIVDAEQQERNPPP